MLSKIILYKIKGFTILELIIAIVISVIIVSIVYTGLLQIQIAWLRFHTAQERITGLAILKKTLDADFENAAYITIVGVNKFSFISETDTIFYTFDSTISRIVNGQVDKFDIIISGLNTCYVRDFEKIRIVKSINFDIVRPMSIQNTSYYKLYTSNDLMKLKFDLHEP